MDPINYVAQFNDPTASVMAGYQTGLDNQAAVQNMEAQQAQLGIQQDQNARAQEMQPYQLEQARLGNVAASQNIQAQSAEIARRDAFRADMARLTELGPNATLQDFVQIETRYPELAGNIRQSYDAMNDANKLTMGTVLAQGIVALQNNETAMAQDLFEQYAQATEASGDAGGAAAARSMVQMLDANPDSVLPFAGLALNMLLPDVASELFDAGSEARVQSSVMVGPTVSVQTMSDGSTRVVDTATNQTLTGQSASDAIAAAQASEVSMAGATVAAREEGKLTTQADLGGQAAAAKSLGGVQADFVKSALEGSSTVAGSISNIQTALNALDAGARVGAIDRYLPNITDASASLENAMNRMGLDVIGSVTFGALSEGELRLAMEVAVPRNLNETELRAWLERKLDAQRKVRAALIEQAQFLSDPNNTLQDWTAMVGGASRSGTPPAQSATPAPAAAPTAQPSFMQFGGGN